MSKAEFKVNGHRCSYISVPHLDGTYKLVFDREWEENTIESLECVDWTRIEVQKLRENTVKCWLPEGYTFQLERITYRDGDRAYEVHVKTDKQCYADVTGYQAKIDEQKTKINSLAATNMEQRSTIAELTEALAEADELVISLYEAQAAAENATETATENADEEVGA